MNRRENTAASATCQELPPVESAKVTFPIARHRNGVDPVVPLPINRIEPSVFLQPVAH